MCFRFYSQVLLFSDKIENIKNINDVGRLFIVFVQRINITFYIGPTIYVLYGIMKLKVIKRISGL